MIRRALPIAVALSVALLPGRAEAQHASPAPAPMGAYTVSGEWLHLNSGSLRRDALPSLGWSIGMDHPRGFRLEAGYLRVARPGTTAKGFTAGAGWNFVRDRVTLRPGVSALIGVAERIGDRDGYDWQGVNGTPLEGDTGHQDRVGYQRGTTLGGSLNFAADYYVGAGMSITASLRQWVFTGGVLSEDRDRVLAGFGLSVRPGALVQSLRGRPATQISSAEEENAQ